MVLTYLHFRILKFPLIYDKYITCRGTTTKEAVSVLSRFGSNSTSDLTGVRRFGHLDSNCGSSKNIYIGDRHHQILKIIYISLSNSERNSWWLGIPHDFRNRWRFVTLVSWKPIWVENDQLNPRHWDHQRKNTPTIPHTGQVLPAKVLHFFWIKRQIQIPKEFWFQAPSEVALFFGSRRLEVVVHPPLHLWPSFSTRRRPLITFQFFRLLHIVVLWPNPHLRSIHFQ